MHIFSYLGARLPSASLSSQSALRSKLQTSLSKAGMKVTRKISANRYELWEQSVTTYGGIEGEALAIKSLWKSAYETLNQPSSALKGAKITVCSSWWNGNLCTTDGVSVSPYTLNQPEVLPPGRPM